MEDITMKRKPKMHKEHEFDMDNIYQEDERQIADLDDYSFDMKNKWRIHQCNLQCINLLQD